MKKTIILATILGSLFSVAALAKTEGNYVGLDLINTNMQVDSTEGYGEKIKYSGDDRGNSNKISAGINYKYAVNINNFFIAPGLTFDYSNAHIKDNEDGKLELDYRYGVKVDLGYDFTDKFASYITVGALNNKYNVDFTSTNDGKKSRNDISTVYGIGAKYSVNNNVDVNIGYEYSRVKMHDPLDNNIKYNTDIKVLRLGAAYKF